MVPAVSCVYACPMPMPKYLQIVADLRARIDKGEYPPGAQLPTRGELAEMHGAALGTVARALDVLRRDGYVESYQGGGIYALRPGEPQLPSWAADLRDQLGRLERRIADVERRLPQ